MSNKIFLTAEWRKLVMANYIIDPSLLKKFVPARTEIDLWNDQCYISLVGFLFKDVRVKGIRVPCHVNFPEINLRFYVRYKEKDGWKHGVVFISEIVPKPAIAFIANKLYKEHYSSMPMSYSWKGAEENIHVSYHWKKRDKWNNLQVIAAAAPDVLKEGSKEEFITEHFWGYSAFSKEKTAEYNVAHPRWDIYPVIDYTIDCDFKTSYGEEFDFLTEKKPDSVFLAEGSVINVFDKKFL